MTRDDIIKMAADCGLTIHGEVMHGVEHFAALVAAAERERSKWDGIHSCGPDCDRPPCVTVRKAVEAEREACAKVCEDSVPTYVKNGERWLKGQNGEPDSRMKDLAPNLEAAWEAEQILKNGSVLESYTVQHQCAAVIRARGRHD